MLLTVSINRMRLTAHHGLLPQERIVGNDFDVSVCVDIRAGEEALRSDSLDSSVSYADLADIVRHVMLTPCDLLETVADNMRRAILERFPCIVGGCVTIEKLTPPIPSSRMVSASVTLRWP